MRVRAEGRGASRAVAARALSPGLGVGVWVL